MVSRFPIVEETRSLVKKENELCAQIIRNLQVIVERKIHAEMGFQSLFNFCVKILGMNEATAQRRCDAVKIAQVIPDLAQQIETGDVTLSRVAEVSRFLRHERKEAKREVTPTQVRALFSQVAAVSNDYEARKILMTQTAAPVRAIPDQKRVVIGGRTVLEFEVDAEFLDLLEAVKNLHSHKGPRKLGELFKDILKDQLQYKHPAFKREPKKNIRIQNSFELAAPGLPPRLDEPEASRPNSNPKRQPEPTLGLNRELDPSPAQKTGLNTSVSAESWPPQSQSPQYLPGQNRTPCRRSRYIPKQIVQAVWSRDQSRCTYRDPAGGSACHSQFRLQLDHIKPFSHGGINSLDNLALRCQTHNLYRADQMGLLQTGPDSNWAT